VERRLATSRSEAQDLVAQKRVLVSGSVADKPSRLIARAEPVVITDPRRFVSRGGEKLDAAIEKFDIPIDGKICLDAGAATGGFTDCLLQRGARRVWSIDVGHGQLAPQVRSHPKVVVFERCNLRHASLESLGAEPFELVVADLSFISLTMVADVLSNELAAPGADMVLLVKPQFEAGRKEVDRGGGVIRDPSIWRSALLGVGNAFESAGAAIMGAMASPLTGPAGNVEFLLHLRTASVGRGDDGASVGRGNEGTTAVSASRLSDLVDSALSSVDTQSRT
jgi:23S rRNA (cytidine1920-2'-O)/16S rRNA (cytidine1409-2'-O)-methyltransferase